MRIDKQKKNPGIFCKFCEPLEKVRARFSYKKILDRMSVDEGKRVNVGSILIIK